MNSKITISRKDYEKMETQLQKMKFKLDSIKKNNPNVLKENLSENDLKNKLHKLESVIGYLVRKKIDSKIPIDVLLEIADDIEKRLKQK